MPNLRFQLRWVWPAALLLLSLSLATGCGDDEDAAPPPGGAASLDLAGTQWVLDADALDVAGADAVTATLVFERERERERVSGSDGCNRFTGPYEQDGTELRFGALAGTQMACSGAAEAVALKVNAALPRVRSAQVAGTALRLKDESGAVLLSYLESPPGIVGRWEARSILWDDAIRGVKLGTQPTAEFASAGAVFGTTGCNRFRGDYELSGERLKIGPLAATKKACSGDPAAAQEAGYLAALESAVRIEQIADELTLFNEKGQMAVTFVRERSG